MRRRLPPNWYCVNTLLMHGACIRRPNHEGVTPLSQCSELEELQKRWVDELCRVAAGIAGVCITPHT